MSFTVDSYERYVEKKAMRLIAAVMKKCGVTQIDISDVELLGEDEILYLHDINGFIRIKGKFVLEEK